MENEAFKQALGKIILQLRSDRSISQEKLALDTDHPDLFNPNLDRTHPDWDLEMKASNQIAKGGESHNPGKG